MEKTIIINNCFDCPFYHWEVDISESNHSGCSRCSKSNREIEWDNKKPRIPKWCPLKDKSKGNNVWSKK